MTKDQILDLARPLATTIDLKSPAVQEALVDFALQVCTAHSNYCARMLRKTLETWMQDNDWQPHDELLITISGAIHRMTQ